MIDLVLVPMKAVVAKLHPEEDVLGAVKRGDLWSDVVRETVAWYGMNEEWKAIHNLSNTALSEVSLLFDSTDSCWVDWGGAGMVGLHPPEGAKIPFKLWVHTHPFGDAYWSLTDQRTLATSTTILEKALVLGQNQILTSTKMKVPAKQGLKSTGPLSQWSREIIQPYPNPNIGIVWRESEEGADENLSVKSICDENPSEEVFVDEKASVESICDEKPSEEVEK